MKRIASAVGLALGVVAFASAVRAEEGMWTFDNIPAARMQEDIGWAPDQSWLDRVRGGVGRLPNCSSANVSGEGLFLTNYHCVNSCVYDLSAGETNYQHTGFSARAREEEQRCENLSILVLQNITDVTARIDAATANAANFVDARDAEIARIEGACMGDAPDKRCEVVTLYQGGRYALYAYKRYVDVRLVFSPEEDAAFFGFPPENFNFPRYSADFAFLRVYEDGAPAATPNHLTMRFTPPAEGEATLIAGHPGSTSRLNTTAQMAFQRDHYLPLRIADLSEWRGRLIAYAARGEREARIASDPLHSAENSLKVFWGRRLALVDAASFARVLAREQDLQARVNRNRAAQREVGDAWGEVARAQEAARANYIALEYLETRAGGGSQLFAWARHIVRAAAEREKPEAARLVAYTPSRISIAERQVLADLNVLPDMEEMQLSFWLTLLRERLTSGDPAVARVLGRESPEALAARLVANTKLADPAERARLWLGGAAAVNASTDPLIVFVRQWDDVARAARQRDVAGVEEPVARARERINRARFRAFGEAAYPDATFTLRLSYGRIAGWTEPDGRVVPPFTYLSGLSQQATGAAPYKMADRWAAAYAALDPQTVFNISSTHDVIGGYSGSPMLDTEGRVVGAVFDGNLHSLGGDYFYDAALNRSITVSSAMMRTALTEIYDLDALVVEIEAP